MKAFFPLLWRTLLCVSTAITAFSQKPTVLLMDGANLARVKQSVKTDKELSVQLSLLLKEADELLLLRPVSVMEKAFLPVSGNKLII